MGVPLLQALNHESNVLVRIWLPVKYACNKKIINSLMAWSNLITKANPFHKNQLIPRQLIYTHFYFST